jgi:hypothetical protein
VTDGGLVQPEATATALSRELRDFLIRFSIALHRFAMYPSDHPSLEPTVQQVIGLVTEFLYAKASLALGVARTQLVIEGVATDPKNPVLLELAQRLHRHHLGAITFERGIGAAELYAFLETVARDPDHSEGPLGLRPDFREVMRWPHISVHPLNYERLRFLEGDAPRDEPEDVRVTRTRAAQLWLGLARAALATGAAEREAAEGNGADDEYANADPTVVAQAIDGRQRDGAYDQVIVGYMLQIADELKAGRGAESGALRRRVSDLVSSLDRQTLARLLSMGGDATQRRRFLLNASEGMAVDAIVDLVQAAGQAGEQTVSHSMLRMLQKLAHHAERGAGRRQKMADVNVRDQLRRLIEGWSLRDPNPGAYGRALQRMSVSTPTFAASAEAKFTTEPRRLVEMALELDTVGEPVERAVDALVERGELPWLLEALRFAYAPRAVEELRRRVARVDLVAALLADDPIDFALLDELVAAVGVGAADPLLDALAEADSASTRRALISRLSSLGAGIEPAILRRLDDDRWYVVRNLLGLLAELPALPETFDPWLFLKHADSRVRREAMRLLLREAGTRERAIVEGLRDADSHIVRLALTAATGDCPDTAIPLVVTRAASGANSDQRVAAIRVLAGSRHPSALATLLQLTARRRGLLGERPPPKTPEYLAALTALQQFADDPRAREVLAQGAQSRDADVARASRAVRAIEN